MIVFVMFTVMMLTSCIEGSGGSSGTSQDLSAVKARFRRLMNDYRVEHGKEAFGEHWVFETVAQDWADYQASVGEYLAHENVQQRYNKAERLMGSQIGMMGENCCYVPAGYDDPAFAAYDALINSPGHLENIMFFTVSGVGVSRDRNGNYYFEQFFAL